MDNKNRIEKAVALFKQGYNCSQSVAAAFADIYGIDESVMLRLSAGFGGGIGRMRSTCGAACGMFILAGLEKGATNAPDNETKGACYQLVQDLAAEFKRKNGSLICAELLGISSEGNNVTKPEERTQAYYKKRPCVKMVEEAARIYSDYLENRQK